MTYVNDESVRIEALRRDDVLDFEPEHAFDDLARLAAHLCGVPIALVNLIDTGRHRVKARIGLGDHETPCGIAFCEQTVRRGDLFVVPDALADPRFAADRMVTSAPGVRFYAGTPLLTPDGFALGTLCVFDRVPRTLSAEQEGSLRALGRQVVSQLELRRALAGRSKAEGELKRSEAESVKLALVAGRTDNAVIITDPDGRIEWVNEGFTRITEYRPEEVIGRAPGSFLQGPETDPAAVALMRDCHLLGEGFRVEIVNDSKGGRKYWLAVDARPVRGDDGRLAHFMAIGTDVTERKERELRRPSEEAQRASEVRLQTVLTSAPVILFALDQEGVITLSEGRGLESLGYRSGELVGRSAVEVFSDVPDFVADTRRALAGETFAAVTEIDGVVFDVRYGPLHDETGSVVGVTGVAHDITEQKRAECRLAHQAMHDALTGLPNRARLQEKLEQTLASGRKSDTPFALLLLDLDRFKEINDTYGHHYGDSVLRQLNPRLMEVVRETDMVARLGGDEFGILLPGTDKAGAARTADRVLAALLQPIVVEGHPLEIGASIGIALHPDHGVDAVALVRRADAAMYAAKRSRSGWAIYSDNQSDLSPRRLAMVGQLRQAIEGDQLRLHYQPKIDLRTRRVVGAEALVRWQHPREGLIAPGEFLPLAERTGLIRPLGLWALETALLQCAAWRAAGLSLKVAVNLSPENLQDEVLVDRIARMLDEYGVDPRSLTLEVTEGAMMADPPRARSVLGRLHAMGPGISIDDFGTGYSSLAYLKALPVDEVKIDRTFVKQMSTSARDACIVRSVIDLGHNLGLRVVAEGVEDLPTLELLASWGCDLAQGFFISRALPPIDFLTWVGNAAPRCEPRPPSSARDAFRLLSP